MYQIKWHKLNPTARIPTKRAEDSGYDLYTIEDNVILPPHSKHLFSTGLTYWIDKNHWLKVEDRGSTGSKGLHVHCGICDQGYRGEIFICISNDNDYPFFITSNPQQTMGYEHVYPTSKGIAQIIPMDLLEGVSEEITDDEWELIKNDSERGMGKLGASGK